MIRFLLFAALMANYSWAKNDLPEFYRGVRAQAMGNAFTAVADDADAVFYNPAGITFNSGVQVRILNPKIDVSADDITAVSDLRRVTSGGFNGSAISSMFGKNLYANGTIYPSILLPHVTFGYYADFNGHLALNNLSLPRADLTYYYDNGFVGGVGFESRGILKKHFARYGLTLKALNRRGYDGSIPITTFVTKSSSFLSSLLSGSAMGYGVDLGLQYEIPLGQEWDWVFGGAWHDIGNTRFGTRLSSNQPPSIPSNLAMGAAAIFRYAKRPGYDVKFSLEGRHLEYFHEDPRKKIHFGTEVSFGRISLQAGMNQLTWSAGAKVDAWIFEVAVASYAVQEMPLYGMSTERRYILQMTTKLDFSSGKSKGSVDEERRKRPRSF